MVAALVPSSPVRADASAVRAKLGELLMAEHKLSKPDLDRALEVQKSVHDRLGRLLVRLGIVAEADVVAALARQAGLQVRRKEAFPAVKPVLDALNPGYLMGQHLLPLGDVRLDAPAPEFVAAAPGDAQLQAGLKLVFGQAPVLHFGLESEIHQTLQDWLFSTDEALDDEAAGSVMADDFIEHLRDLASEAPIIQRVSHMFTVAVQQGASDIHIESYEDRSVVRIRVDGQLFAVDEIEPAMAPAVVSRIKILSHLDIAERRLPQDGRTKIRVQGREMDARVSTAPTMFGESVVIRLLERNMELLSLDHLQFNPEVLSAFRHMLKTPHGIVLVTGPTGSGKSTTLYASMRELKGDSLKILTVEDPVEYQLEWLNQVQVQPQIGLTFAKALRSFLRQDPDVIMIGEMRDTETAEIAVQAALTGHLVLSTLHTNSSLGAMVRLINMGLEPFLINASVMGVLAQRLVRRLCPACKAPLSPQATDMASRLLNEPVPEGRVLYGPVGCPSCRGTGYSGRVALHELLLVTDEVKRLIMEQGAAVDGRGATYAAGTLLQDGARKVFDGLTTAEEVLTVAQQDD